MSKLKRLTGFDMLKVNVTEYFGRTFLGLFNRNTK